jgi:hypothetical protein
MSSLAILQRPMRSLSTTAIPLSSTNVLTPLPSKICILRLQLATFPCFPRDSLPKDSLLEAQCVALFRASPRLAVRVLAPPCSILDRDVVVGFAGAGVGPPLALVHSSATSRPHSVSFYFIAGLRIVDGCCLLLLHSCRLYHPSWQTLPVFLLAP